MAAQLEICRDSDLRQQLFGSSVMQHPAKQNLKQLVYLLERFGSPGKTLLDPFGGVGSAMLATSSLYGGMNVITVELAPHFLPLQWQAWEHFTESQARSFFPVTGDYSPLKGDSRCLVNVLAAHGYGGADLIISSPSYGGSEAVDRRTTQNTTIAHHGGGNAKRNDYKGRERIARLSNSVATTYGPHSQISAKMAGYVDLIVSSPPYQDALSHNRHDDDKDKRDKDKRRRSENPHGAIIRTYGADCDNIGNLRGDKYLASMRQVWQQAAMVLRPGGVLCCITRDCVRKGQRVPVGEQNKALLIEAGLTFLEREVWRVPTMSFWRTLQHKKHPESPIINSEDVWIFRKQGM